MTTINAPKLCYIFTFIAFVLLTIISCTAKEEQTSIIKLEPEKSPINLSSYVKKVEYIALKTDKHDPIGAIINVEIFNNLIFIKHSPRNPKLSVFTNSGEHLYNIGKLGNGPKEYAHMQSFTIDKKNKHVLMMDLVKQKIHIYGIDGTFIKSENTPVLPIGIAYINSEIVFYLGNLYNEVLNANVSDFCNIVVTDTLLEEKSRHLKVPNKFKGLIQGSAPSSLSIYNNTINITQPLSNVIYCYRDGIVEPRFKLDFGSLTCDFESELSQYNGNPSTFAPHLEEKNYSFPPDRFFEFNDLIYFDFTSNKEKYYVFYDKKRKTPDVGNAIKDDIKRAIFGLPIGRWDEKLITVIEPMVLLDENTLPQEITNMNLNLTSNPILGIFTLK